MSNFAKPRVLFISPQPFMAHRGSPLRVKSVVEAIAQLGHEVDLLAYPMGEDIEIPGVRILRGYKLPFVSSVRIGPSVAKFLLDVLLFVRACTLVFRRRYVALHGVEEAAFIAAILGRCTRTPYFVDMHSAMEHQLRNAGLYSSRMILSCFSVLFAWTVEGAAGVMTVCNELTDRSSKRYNIPAFTVPDLPLDVSRQMNAATVKQLRQELRLENQAVILYAGNLAWYQGVELLIRAFNQLLSSAPDRVETTLVILGGGPEEEKDRQALMQLAKELGIADKVRFIPARPSSETGNYLALADVLASPRLEGCNIPLKIYSYLAAQRPIVATRISAHTQVLNEDTAYMCDVEVGSIADALGRALEQSEQAKTSREQLLRRASNLVDAGRWHSTFRASISALYGLLTPFKGAKAEEVVHQEVS